MCFSLDIAFSNRRRALANSGVRNHVPLPIL
jgi:hypothetical protein